MYSVKSIIDELKTNKDFTCDNIDDVKCPSPSTHDCPNPKDPADCKQCLNRNCTQKMVIYYKNKRLGLLFPKFMVSTYNQDGFIDENDSSLTQMIRRGLDKKKFAQVI